MFAQHREKLGMSVPAEDMEINGEDYFAYKESSCFVNLVLWATVSLIKTVKTGKSTTGMLFRSSTSASEASVSHQLRRTFCVLCP